MKKRLLATMLALCMVITMLPVTAMAVEEDTGETSEADSSVVQINTAEDLVKAINNQKDGQTWILAEGTYDVKNEEEGGYTLADENKINGSTGPFAFPIYVDNLTIRAADGADVTITSTYDPNSGNWCAQNFLTISGAGITIEGVNLKGNPNGYYGGLCNKVIELVDNAKNFTLKDVELLPLIYEEDKTVCSGSIYFSNSDADNTTLKNVTMYSWISARNVNDGIITMDGVTLDYTNNTYAGYEGYGLGVSGDQVVADDLTYRVDNDILLVDQIFDDELKDGITVVLESGEYQVDEGIYIYADDITIEGEGAVTIRPSNDFHTNAEGQTNLMKLLADGITLKNLTLETTEDAKHVLDVWGADDILLEDVTLDHTYSSSSGGAPLIVNGSNVTVAGDTKFITGNNSWYAINVDDNKDDNPDNKASITFESDVTFEDSSNTGKAPILVEPGTDPAGAVQGIENITTPMVIGVSVVDGTDGYTPVTSPVAGQKLTANIQLNDSVIGSYPVDENAHYQWYYKESPDTILGTEPTYTVTADNTGKTLCLLVTVDGYAGRAVWAASDQASAPNKSVYTITINAPDQMAVGEKYTGASATLSADVVGTNGYSNVQFRIEMTQKPDDSNPRIMAEDINGTEWNLAETGTWGPDSGFPIGADYSATTSFTELSFDMPGTYTAKISLVDVSADGDEAVLATATKTITVSVFEIQNFNIWGSGWYGAYSVDWKYMDGFDTADITGLEVGMKDAAGNLIIKYTADADQAAWQRTNGYITTEGLSSAPFYKEYNGTAVAEGRDDDWTIEFGPAFDKWDAYTCYVKVQTNDWETELTKDCTHQHAYTAEIVSNVALKSAATTSSPAVYYKTCPDCGAISSNDADTFTYCSALPGEPDEPDEPDEPSNPGSSGDSSSSSTSVRRYNIEADAGRGGDISPDGRVRVRRGENQTFRITADDGWEIADVEVDGESVGAVERYTFENVRTDHTISATFQQIVTEPEEPETPTLPFTDVSEGDWYHDAVAYCWENGIMDGTSGTAFAPNMLLNRAMMAQVLYNLAGGTPAAAAGFPDVSPTAWYADAVNWAAANGYVTGYDNGLFGPEDDLTREQMAAILYRYAGSPAPAGSLDGFADAASASAYAVDALRWAVGEGLLTGKDGGRLDPTGTASRAELAQILARFAG